MLKNGWKITGGVIVASWPTINGLYYWQRPTVSREPLLRFPFVHYLVNPCGLVSANSPVLTVSGSPPYRQELQPMRTLSDDVPVDVRSHQFLSDFRDFYTSARNDTAEKRDALIQEFWLVVNEARQLARRVYPLTVRSSLCSFKCFEPTSNRSPVSL